MRQKTVTVKSAPLWRGGQVLIVMPVRVTTVRQIQKLDKIAIEKYGVPSLALMENAGRSIAYEVLKQVKKIKRPRICIICGLGHNAGDGLVAARHLINAGAKVNIFLIGKGSHLRRDAAVNYQILKRLKYPVKEIRKADGSVLKDITRADITVDAIFGVGLNRDILDPFRGIIEAVNRKAQKVIAVDIPSGLDGTTGKIYGTCIKADTTVTFSLIKKGFLIAQGPKYVGKLIVADIGIPMVLKREIS